MATYKINLKNPYTEANIFHININGRRKSIKLLPYESVDLTTIHPDFTIVAGSTTEKTLATRISKRFMSNGSNPRILLNNHLDPRTGTLRIKHKTFTDFIKLTT